MTRQREIIEECNEYDGDLELDVYYDLKTMVIRRIRDGYEVRLRGNQARSILRYMEDDEVWELDGPFKMGENYFGQTILLKLVEDDETGEKFAVLRSESQKKLMSIGLTYDVLRRIALQYV